MSTSRSVAHYQDLEQTVLLMASWTSSRVHLYNATDPEPVGVSSLLAPAQQELVAARAQLGMQVDHYHFLPVAPLLPGLLDYETRTAYRDGAPPEERLGLCEHFGITGSWRELVLSHPHLVPLMFQRNSSPAFLQRFLEALVPGSTVRVFDVESPVWRSDVPPAALESGNVHIVFELDGPHQWHPDETLLRDVISRLSVHPSRVTFSISRLF